MVALGRLHSTKEISRPVLPPIFPNALYAEEPTLEIAAPAELWTRVRPSEAFETACLPDSCALEAASEAVEACLKLFRRRSNLDWRRMARDAGVADMAAEAL